MYRKRVDLPVYLYAYVRMYVLRKTPFPRRKKKKKKRKGKKITREIERDRKR